MSPFTIGQIAEALGITPSPIKRRAKKGRWPFTEQPVRGGRQRLYHLNALPEEIQAALLLKFGSSDAVTPTALAPSPSEEGVSYSKAYDRDSLWSRFDRIPQSMKDKAEQRRNICAAVADMVDRGAKITAALDAIASTSGVARATVTRWWYSLDGIRRDDWLAWLAPRYTGRQPDAECSPEAWAWFKTDWLRLSQPSASGCYERLQRVAASKGWKIPSLRTLMRRIERELPGQLVVLKRKGEEAFSRTAPSKQRDHSVFCALEAVNADGHKFDVFCRWPDGTIARPVMLAWQDIYSAKILSYRVDLTEHSGLVRLSFGDLIERYGIPDHAFLDNGRGFASKLVSGGVSTRYRFKVKDEEPHGILKNMGVKVHWATPYHGQAKPIERAFKDLCDRVAKHTDFEGAYCGNSPTTKPENYGSRAVPIDKFLRVLDQEIIAHNQRSGRTSKVCAGRSFDEAFNESYARAQPRKPTAEQRRLWLLAAEDKKLSSTDGSLQIMGNRYWSEQLSNNAGERVIARFDPDNLHQGVHVYTLDGRYIGFAACENPVGFIDVQAGKAHAKATRHRKRLAKQLAEMEIPLSPAEAARMLPDLQAPETPDPKVVRLVTGSQVRTVCPEETEQRYAKREAQFATAVKAAWQERMKGRI